MHRAIMGAEHGDAVEIDHADRNRLNNTRANLRIATRSLNEANKPGYSSSSGYKGAATQKGSGTFFAQIHIDGKRTMVAGLKSIEDAARVYDSLALYYYGEFAFVNFPDSQPKTLEQVLEENPARRSTSKHKGVSFHRPTARWKATLGRKYGRRFLGYFNSEKEAAEAIASALENL